MDGNEDKDEDESVDENEDKDEDQSEDENEDKDEDERSTDEGSHKGTPRIGEDKTKCKSVKS